MWILLISRVGFFGIKISWNPINKKWGFYPLVIAQITISDAVKGKNQ